MFENNVQNYYEVLDIKPDASQNDIRQAYLRLKVAYGKNSAALYSIFDEQETRRVLDKVEEAYLVLSNPDKRKEYDQVHGFLGGALKQEQPVAVQTPPPTPVPPAQQSEGKDIALQTADSFFGTHEDVPRETEDYSTPRTLASHGAAGPPVQDYTFNSYENRIGTIRRVDLVKPYRNDPQVEDWIGKENNFTGDVIRKIREYKAISIDELAEFTKISRSYINCIETDAFDSLPAPVYLRGFVIQIARALKLPHEKVAQSYMAHYRNSVMK